MNKADKSNKELVRAIRVKSELKYDKDSPVYKAIVAMTKTKSKDTKA
jgi:hypothetical protein